MSAIFASDDYAKQASYQEAVRQKRIKEGTASIDRAFSGFTPEFYQQRERAYEDFALPQVSQQYRTTKNDIDFNLGNRGLFGNTSAKRKQYSDLTQQDIQARQGVVDAAINQSQALRSQIESSKDQQLGFLYQSADPAGATASATAAAASFATPSVPAAIGNAFAGLLNQYYYNQLINSYKPTSYVAPQTGGSGFAPIGGSSLSVTDRP